MLLYTRSTRALATIPATAMLASAASAAECKVGQTQTWRNAKCGLLVQGKDGLRYRAEART